MHRLAFTLLVLVLSAPAHAAFDFTHDWYETGTVGDGWGDAVCTVGDVNGDGYSDILVGSPYYGTGSFPAQGKISLYHGSPTGPGSTPVWEFWPNFANAQLGYSIAPAGDFDGDGYADFVAGAPGYSGGGRPSQGRVYFFRGGHTPQWWTQADSGDEGARLGHSVAWAGDVNGDGYDDVIAGAPYWGGFGSPFYIVVQGRAYVHFGGPNGPDGIADWTRSGGDEDAEFGFDVAGLGDVNGDGYADIAVGKPGYDTGLFDNNRGIVYAYHGSAGGPATSPNWTHIGANDGDAFGTELAHAGDFNGDGFCDALIGVPGYNGGAGGLYVASGGPSGLGPAGLWQSALSSGWGSTVSTIGDFNGDGCTDFVVGGGTNDDAYVYFGGPVLTLEHVINGTGQFAKVVASAGDVDGDGLGDFLVCDPVEALGAGALRLYLGGREIQYGVPLQTTVTGSSTDALGTGFSDAGDVNGDGIGDLLAGAPGAAGGGAARVYYGGVNGMSTTPGWTGAGGAGSVSFGAEVAAAGDVNGDGYADIVVGDPGARRIHVFHGSPTGPSALPDFTHAAPVAFTGFGSALCGGGDLNGDGYADIAAGAPLYDDGGIDDQGIVRVFFGAPFGFVDWGYVDIPSGVAGARFGSALAIPGDVDGDEFDDLAVGAPGYATSGPGNNGRVSVFYGAPSGFPAGAWHRASSTGGNQLGYAVAAAGDIDGDGYADLLVGEPFADITGIDSGMAHVYLGGPSPFTTWVDFVPPGSPGDLHFGRTVTGLGDYDGSGRSLVAVGRLSSTQTISRVDVYELDSNMMRRSAFELGYPFADFGICGVGDVDADGSPDIGFGQPMGQGGGGEVRIHGPFPARATLPPAPRARVTVAASGAPIALRGRLDATEDIRFHMRAWAPVGRTRLRLQWAIAEERFAYVIKGNGPWTPAATHIGGTDLGADQDTPLSMNARYRWRIRVQARNPYVPFGPWLTAQPNTDALYALRVRDTPSAVREPAPEVPVAQIAAAPNPFRRSTQIEFRLEESGGVSLSIHDVAGRAVRTLDPGILPAGIHRLSWDGMDDAGRSVASGVYHAVMRTASGASRLKMTLLR